MPDKPEKDAAPEKTEQTRVDRIIEKARNHPVLSKAIVAGMTITAVAAVVVAVDQVRNIFWPPPLETAPPNALEDAAEVIAGRSIVLDVLKNDSGEGLRLVGVNTSASGTLKILEHKKLRYTAPTKFSGTDSFSYQVRDSQGRGDSSFVSITVKPREPDPVRTTRSVFHGGSHSVVPRHVGGDREFNGHGPSVSLLATLRVDKTGRSVQLRLSMTARETKKDYSRFEGAFGWKTIWTAPRGKRIVRILSPTRWDHRVVMKGKKPQIITPRSGSLVAKATIVGDRRGKDQPRVSVRLGKMEVLVR